MIISATGYVELTSKSGEASILAPVSSIYLVIPVLVGIFLWKEPRSLQKFFGILLAIAAVVLLALSPNQKLSIGTPTNIAWFLLCVLCWGFASVLYVWASKIPEAIWSIVYVASGFSTLTLFVVGAVYHDEVSLHRGREEFCAFFAGFTQGIATALYLITLRQHREASRLSPLGSLYVLVTVILGLAILGEPLTAYKGVGTVLACIAVLLLATKNVRELFVLCLPSRARAKVYPIDTKLVAVNPVT